MLFQEEWPLEAIAPLRPSSPGYRAKIRYVITP